MPASTIYYWYKRHRLDTGHAALAINHELYVQLFTHNGYLNTATLGPVSPDDLYVSWLGAASKGLLKPHRGVAHDMDEDAQQFRGYRVHQVNLGGSLDREAMVEAWREIRGKHGAHWKLMSKNCATVVRRVLKAGGCDRYVRRWDWKHGLFSPQKLYHYAKDAARHLPGGG